ncbi:uncharacterized protein TNCV_1073311 [Trichonephila clavipes]|nr:uncharacterized protein TNCV_1073311 [Trichonephila clavipes]
MTNNEQTNLAVISTTNQTPNETYIVPFDSENGMLIEAWPNHHIHFQHGLPPYPCSICTQQGFPNAYHWKLLCPFNQHRLRQIPFTCDSSLAINTVSQRSENSVGSQQIPNQRQHLSTEASDPKLWQFELSGHISSLPSLANLNNLLKQNSVNIVIDTGDPLYL